MKTLEKGPEKIKTICKVLRDEALEPAQKESQEIIKSAHKQAEQIVAEAQKEADKLLAAAKTKIDQEQNVFQSSLQQAAKQSVELLKQKIESHFFNGNLSALIDKSASDPNVVATLIKAIVKALEAEGMAADLTALVPKSISERQVNELLIEDMLSKLREKSVVIGDFTGGAQLRINNKKLTIDLSSQAIKELLSSHLVRKDFRKMVFEC